MASSAINVSGSKVIQTADLRGGEPPKYSLVLPEPVTLPAEEGGTVKTDQISLVNGEFFRDAFQDLVGKPLPVTGEVKLSVEAHRYPAFDFSPAHDSVEAFVSKEDVTSLTGKDDFQLPFS